MVQRFFIFTPIWGRFPFWLIFFRGVETTKQDSLSGFSFKAPTISGKTKKMRENGSTSHVGFLLGFLSRPLILPWCPWPPSLCLGKPAPQNPIPSILSLCFCRGLHHKCFCTCFLSDPQVRNSLPGRMSVWPAVFFALHLKLRGSERLSRNS